MNKKKRPALLFVLTALLVTVCRCQANPMQADLVPITFSDGSVSECTGLTEILEAKEGATQQADAPEGTTSNYVYECKVDCPDGSVAKFDLYEHPASGKQDKAVYQEKYCSAEAMIAAIPSETPTEVTPTEVTASTEATATSTSTEVPTQQVVVIAQNLFILPPVLAGGVSACDTGTGFINFPLSSQVPDLTGKKVTVSLNGREVNCSVSGSQNQLLGCSLPEGTTFPATVKVSLDDVEVNNFSFDGAICTKTAATKDKGSKDPTASAPTEPPVDCIADPDNPACS